MKCLSVLLLALLVVGTWATTVDAAAEKGTAAVYSVLDYKRKDVSKWSVVDAANWMNHTVGYPEYTAIMKLHSVDGPTLLLLHHDDLLDSFGLTHPLHLVKLKAHLKILRGQCLCPQRQDFWWWHNLNLGRVYTLGAAAVYTPRVAMFYTYFFEPEMIQDIVGGVAVNEEDVMSVVTKTETAAEGAEDATPSEGAENVNLVGLSTFSQMVYLVSTVLFPRLWQAYQLSGLFWSNYFITTATWIILFSGQLGEIILILSLAGDFRDGHLPSVKVFFTDYLNPYHMAVPVATFVTSYVFPYFLQDLALYVFFLHSLIIGFGTVQVLIHFLTEFRKGMQEGQKAKSE